jgi:hypothetical protein
MAETKLAGRQLNFQGAKAFSGSSGVSNSMIVDNVHGLVLSASRIYLSGSPADNLEAATKGYVDSIAGGGVTSNQIAFGNDDGSGVASDSSLWYDPNSDIVGVSGSIQFGHGTTANSIHGTSATGLMVSGSGVKVTSSAALDLISAAFDINASGVVGIDSDAAMTLGALSMDIDADGGAIDIDATAAVSIDSSAGSMTMGAILTDGQTLKLGKNSAVEMVFTPHGTPASELISLTNTAGTAVSDSAAAVQVTATAGAVTLSGGVANAAAVRLVSSDTAGGVDIDAGTGGLTLDSTGIVSIDAADNLNLTVTSSAGAEDLTIQQVGANDSSIIITAAGTGADAVSIDATAGSMVIASSLANEKTLTIGPSSATQMVFTPHGTAASEKISLTNTSGTADDAISIVSTAGGVTVQAGNDSIFLDADGTDADALNIDSAGGVDVDAAGLISLNSTAGSIEATVVDGQTVTVGLSGASALLLSPHGTAGSEKASLIVTSGDATDALKLQAAAGGVDIDAALVLALDGAGGINIGAQANVAVDVNASTFALDATSTFSVDAVGASNVTTRGVLTLSGSTQALITSMNDAADSIVLNANNVAGGIKHQVVGSDVMLINAEGVQLRGSPFIGTTGRMILSGSQTLELPNYIHNSAIVTSASAGVTDYGTVTAGSGIAAGVVGGVPAGKDLGVSLMTGSLFVLGGVLPTSTTGLVPESLRVYQNGLLLASGALNDYQVVNYAFVSASKMGFDVKLYTAPVVGDVFQVDVSAQTQG